VQSIAHELGYSSASALIVMFQQQAGTTPDRYREGDTRSIQRKADVSTHNKAFYLLLTI
jgi:AraC-like DNA-binding protein